MKIYLRIFLFLLISFEVSPARNNDIYFIKDLKISVKHKSPIEAKKNALKSARRTALKKILKSLNIDPNFNESLSHDEIAQMTRSEQIKNKKISKNVYSADFTFKFSQSFIENILTEKNIPIGIEKREKYSILPLKITNNNKMIFLSKHNDWKKSWEDFLIENEQNIYLFNKNSPNFETIQKIPPYKLLSLPQDIANRLLNNNEEYIPIIAIYKYDKSQNKIKIKLLIVRKYENKTLNLTLTNTGFLSEKNFTKEAIKNVLNYIEKNRFKSKKNSQLFINIKVQTKFISEITKIRSILENIKEIDSVEISSTSRKASNFKISYNSNYDIFEIFYQNNLKLYLNKNNEYLIK